MGPEAFRDDVGHFWGLIETRPYMRAREGLASTLWTMGRRDEAIGHLQDMLRLNPNDNQGVRDTLAGWILAEERDEDLARLFEQYDEETTHWVYSKALVAFRQHGDTPESRRLLQRARKANQHVPAYLLGQKPLPLERPSWYSPGDRNEAILYAGGALSGWKETPGATAWLKATEQTTKRSKDPTPVAQGPTSPVKERLQHLSQGFDVWQADFRLTPHWIKIGGEPVRPWVVLITSRSDDLVLAHEIIEERVDARTRVDLLVADRAASPGRNRLGRGVIIPRIHRIHREQFLGERTREVAQMMSSRTSGETRRVGRVPQESCRSDTHHTGSLAGSNSGSGQALP